MDLGNLCMKISKLNADFSSPSANHLGSRTPAQVGIKVGYPPKNGYFTGIGSLAWKQLKIGADILLIIRSTSDELFYGVNIDDLEWPWTTTIRGFSVFSNFRLQRTFQEWIAPKQLEIDLNNLCMKFLA